MIPTIMRYTANTAMALGVIIVLLAGWDYWRGPGAGQGVTLICIGVGVAVFFMGYRVFRRMAADLEH